MFDTELESELELELESELSSESESELESESDVESESELVSAVELESKLDCDCNALWSCSLCVFLRVSVGAAVGDDCVPILSTIRFASGMASGSTRRRFVGRSCTALTLVSSDAHYSLVITQCFKPKLVEKTESVDFHD